ncbi:antitoxin component YwqK of YwqJK toxin-antitoxin module [Gelidibacter algens]|uniref:Antitoxin component YwqK of YwqJK toxin-antitoxin module n=1 Tax=Gelidibacter algens TaxID=49280 RepID=A0A1A7R272_9FLAO|nr:preprotein translocase YidC [Gelidibacter algens]OBX25931.1 preprotein translocase YidC [Gelidibacter algens]RAJ25268.1 antitoxin component YwqK of YwqJK toxin-antitoxin module [Gelidibacter algens]
MIKQNTLFVLFLTLFLTTSHAQDGINLLDNEGKRHGLWKKNYEGTDQPRYEGTFKHGKEAGVFKFYKLDQKRSVLSATRAFNPDSDDILVKFFSSKGKLISEGHMTDTLFVGKWVYYHNKSKAIMTVEHYNIKGKLEGERMVYYENGQMAEHSNHINGKMEGISKIFSEKGVVIKEFSYKNDMLNGMSKYYNGAGELVAEGAYRNDQKHGIWKYYENGVLTEEKDFTVYSKNPKKQ